MARGKSCGCCGHPMYAQQENYEAQGTWVTYVCRNSACTRCNGKCTHSEKVFEGK